MTEGQNPGSEQSQPQGPDIAALAAFAFNEKPAEAAVAATANLEPGQLAVTEPADEIVDVDAFIKENFGFDSVDNMKTEWENLQNLKKNPPKAEHTFADPEAEKWYKYFTGKKEDELRETLIARKTVSGLETMSDDAKLKLYIKMQNPLYDQELVDAVYNRNYTFNEASFKDEEEIVSDPIALKLAKVDATQKLQNDLQKAGEFFSQYRSKIELPEIQSNQQPDESYQAYQASTAKAREDYEKVVVPALTALSENDIPLSFTVNDTNNQMVFDVNLALEKADLDKAKGSALNFNEWVSKSFYDESGKFLPNKLARAIALEQNFDKYAQSIARQAVNAERKRVIGKETPVINMEKNFTVEEQSEIKKLEKLVFPGL